MTRNPAGFFVIGTDTGVGKTHVSCALLHRARSAGRVALGMKPVAAGTVTIGGEARNEDVLALAAASSFEAPGRLINPYCFAEPIAPHIAAARAGVRIDPQVILAAAHELAAQGDWLLVEGVGGFRVPLGPDYDSADLAADLGLPLVLVVGMRLGCLSHALLTVEAVRARGLVLAGWVANRIDPAMASFDDNLAALQSRIAAPLLGVVAHGDAEHPERAAPSLELPQTRPAADIVVLDCASEIGRAHHDRVVITASHGGLSAVHHAARVRPRLVLFNDAGGGKDDAGSAGLALLEREGIAAACYSHLSARIGDGRDAFANGRLSTLNRQAEALGLQAGELVVAAVSRVSALPPRA